MGTSALEHKPPCAGVTRLVKSFALLDALDNVDMEYAPTRHRHATRVRNARCATHMEALLYTFLLVIVTVNVVELPLFLARDTSIQ